MFSYLLLEIIKFSTLKFIPRLVSGSARTLHQEEGKTSSTGIEIDRTRNVATIFAFMGCRRGQVSANFAQSTSIPGKTGVIDLLSSADPVLDQNPPASVTSCQKALWFPEATRFNRSSRLVWFLKSFGWMTEVTLRSRESDTKNRTLFGLFG